MNRIIYTSFIRYPAEKAHALYVAKTCEAFVKLGHQVTLIVPRRHGVARSDHKEYFHLRQDFAVKRLWCIDLLWLPVFKAMAHKLGLVSFGLWTFWALRDRSVADALVFTNDVFLALILSYTNVRVVYEVHDYPTGQWWLYHWVAKRVYKIQTNNQQKVARVVADMKVSESKVYAVHNGVDLETFAIEVSKAAARAKLALPSEKHYAVYTGHLYDWKGAHVLAEAAKYLPEVEVLFVGGTKTDVKAMKAKYGSSPNIHWLGHQPHEKIPYYLKAADVLVLPNSAQSDLSVFHTSPMKLFEYMASGRPIVASDLPTVHEVVTDSEVLFVTPDDSQALAHKIKKVLEDAKESEVRALAAQKLVEQFDWAERAQLILSHCNEETSSK